MNPQTPTYHAGLIWAITDLLRGGYRSAEYQRVFLPMVPLRRLGCVLEPTRAAVPKHYLQRVFERARSEVP